MSANRIASEMAYFEQFAGDTIWDGRTDLEQAVMKRAYHHARHTKGIVFSVPIDSPEYPAAQRLCDLGFLGQQERYRPWWAYFFLTRAGAEWMEMA